VLAITISTCAPAASWKATGTRPAHEEAGKISGSLLLLVFLLAAIFPFLVMLSVSLQDMNQIYTPGLSLIPRPPRPDVYRIALGHGNWLRYLANSFYVAGMATAISLIINAMTGYAFARIRFPLRRLLFVLILTGMMIPAQVTLVPLFILIRHFPLAGGNNAAWPGRQR
jgi:multiple sugar transport system permease protein